MGDGTPNSGEIGCETGHVARVVVHLRIAGIGDYERSKFAGTGEFSEAPKNAMLT